MKTYEITYSTAQPNEIEITDTKVFIASDIIEATRAPEGLEETCYQYKLIEYDKDEYLAILSQNQQDITALQEELRAAKILLGVE